MKIHGGVTAVGGYKVAGMYGGLRPLGQKLDLTLVTCDVDAIVPDLYNSIRHNKGEASSTKESSCRRWNCFTWHYSNWSIERRSCFFVERHCARRSCFFVERHCAWITSPMSLRGFKNRLNLYVGDNFVVDVSLTTKILAGLTTGALAISAANPTNLVKVCLQAEEKLAAGVPRHYFGALNAYSTIVKQEGVKSSLDWTRAKCCP